MDSPRLLHRVCSTVRTGPVTGTEISFLRCKHVVHSSSKASSQCCRGGRYSGLGPQGPSPAVLMTLSQNRTLTGARGSSFREARKQEWFRAGFKKQPEFGFLSPNAGSFQAGHPTGRRTPETSSRRHLKTVGRSFCLEAGPLRIPVCDDCR